MTINGSRFTRDSHVEQLAPIYAVAAQEIEDYIRFCLLSTAATFLRMGLYIEVFLRIVVAL